MRIEGVAGWVGGCGESQGQTSGMALAINARRHCRRYDKAECGFFVCFVFLGGGRVVGGGVGREGEGQRGRGEEERGGSKLLSL